jgi:deoxyribose-phosphate aldolase
MHYSTATIAAVGAELQHRSVGFIQTSSGFQTRAVTEDHIRLLREHLPPEVSIKAVGGVGDLAHAQVLLNAGAVRVGTHSAVSIAREERAVLSQRQNVQPSHEGTDHG